MMKIGFNIDHGGLEYKEILKLAKLAEDLGYDSVSLYDHLYSLSDPSEKLLETWSLLPNIANNTKKINILPLVTNNIFRHPGVLAKMASSVDLLSRGRLIFGIGAGWYEKEALDFGFSFPKTRVRMEMLEESLQVILKLWIEDAPSFQGKYYKLENAESLPKPYRKPHPPILVGGRGEKMLLKIAAKYADMTNFLTRNLSVEECSRLLAVLKTHCASVGRDYTEIEKTISGPCFIVESESELSQEIKSEARRRNVSEEEFENQVKTAGILGTPEQVKQKLREYEEIGISGAMLRFLRPVQKEKAELFAMNVLRKLQE